jgi:hypothetical protein
MRAVAAALASLQGEMREMKATQSAEKGRGRLGARWNKGPWVLAAVVVLLVGWRWRPPLRLLRVVAGR